MTSATSANAGTLRNGCGQRSRDDRPSSGERDKVIDGDRGVEEQDELHRRPVARRRKKIACTATNIAETKTTIFNDVALVSAASPSHMPAIAAPATVFARTNARQKSTSSVAMSETSAVRRVAHEQRIEREQQRRDEDHAPIRRQHFGEIAALHRPERTDECLHKLRGEHMIADDDSHGCDEQRVHHLESRRRHAAEAERAVVKDVARELPVLVLRLRSRDDQIEQLHERRARERTQTARRRDIRAER